MLIHAGAVWLLLLAYAAVSSSQQYNPYGTGYDGRLCNPPYGFRRNPCGLQEVIQQQIEPACEYLWGPNVCLYTDTILSNEVEYRYKQSCYWTYSHYYYTWVKTCSFICQPTQVCLDDTQEFDRTYEQCCPGFAPRAPQPNTYNQYYHYGYYTPLKSDPLGCPVAVGDSLLECLEIQGLSEFISYLNNTPYLSLLNSTGAPLTVFAPSNAAFEQAHSLVFLSPTNPNINISMLVGNHLVRGNITKASLEQHGAKIYTNMEGRNLHRVSVSFGDYSYITHTGYTYQDTPATSAKSILIPFINGAQVVIEDACKTVNGSLQIIDQVLMPTEVTIAEILRLLPDQFSMFTAALESVNLLEFLDDPDVSRTLFAVPNDAFADAFPPDLLTCLMTYMRRPLNDLLLFHIADEAHYNTSLGLKDFIYTLLQKFIRVELDSSSSTILLGMCQVPIIEQNLGGANGVIHTVDKVLFPQDFNFGMCTQFVPSPSPAVCDLPSPSPSPSPTIIITSVAVPSATPMPTMSLEDPPGRADFFEFPFQPGP